MGFFNISSLRGCWGSADNPAQIQNAEEHASQAQRGSDEAPRPATTVQRTPSRASFPHDRARAASIRQSLDKSSPLNQESSSPSKAVAPQPVPPESSQIGVKLGTSASRTESPGPGSVTRFVSGIRKDIDKKTGMKRHFIGDVPVGPSYQRQSAADKANKEPELFVETHRSKLYIKRNPESPYLTKVVKTHVKDETQEKINIRYRFAKLVNKNSKMGQHFAVEFFVGTKKGANKYYVRRIKDGFSLDKDEQLAEAFRSGELSLKTFEKKIEELAKAVKWMRKQGIYHCDIQPSNIIYDRTTKKLVLTDFELIRDQPKSWHLFFNEENNVREWGARVSERAVMLQNLSAEAG